MSPGFLNIYLKNSFIFLNSFAVCDSVMKISPCTLQIVKENVTYVLDKLCYFFKIVVVGIQNYNTH